MPPARRVTSLFISILVGLFLIHRMALLRTVVPRVGLGTVYVGGNEEKKLEKQNRQLFGVMHIRVDL